jgi:mRNA-degrading endonuclease RelE of RelBE toxin-antitoxin system
MREIDITEKCLDFVDSQGERASDKFFKLILIIEEVKVVHTNFVKKLTNTKFYELRIKAGNEYRVIIFAIDHLNFSECTRAVCLNGFIKKSNKDYIKAIKEAEKILEQYLKSRGL